MDLPADMHQKELQVIQSECEESYTYFRENYERFNKFQKFLWQSNWTDSERSTLQNMGKPDDEFNILQAFIDRLIGEFSKQEPSAEVHSDEHDKIQLWVMEILSAHLNDYINNDYSQRQKKQIYKDMLAGGFSVGKVYADYINESSMEQNIFFDRVFDPTLCYFDPLAREMHKGDGNYCGECYPLEEREFKERYPGVSLEGLSFGEMQEGFNWSYKNGTKKIIIVRDHYRKKRTRKKICKVKIGDKYQTMNFTDFKRLQKQVENDPTLTILPILIGKPRSTFKTEIVRYRVMRTKILEYEVTDYNHLPLVFFDGNSVILKQHDGGESYQFTKPYIYHAYDAQRFKNFCGSSWANSVENQVQHKWIIAKEAIPKEPELRNGILNNQVPNVVVFNSVHENNPELPINNPIREVQSMPAPPEITQGFQVADSLMQMILGSYDASLGINDNQLSGIAVVEAASQSNAAAMPYIDGFLEGLTRCLQIYVELFPKYNKTPRTIPIKTPEGKREYIPINYPQLPPFEYPEGILNVKVKAGHSFQVQQSKTLKVVEGLMSVNPVIAQFFGQEGLDFLLDNIECKGIEQLREKIPEFVKRINQQQQQQQMEAQANNPNSQMQTQIEMQKLQMEERKLQLESQKQELEYKVKLLQLEAEHNKIDAQLHMNHSKEKADLEKSYLDHAQHLDKHSLEIAKYLSDETNKEGNKDEKD